MRGSGGFTFIEIIVAMTIFALVLTAIAAAYVAGYASFARENQRIEVQENLRYALNRMSRNLRQAEKILSVGGVAVEPGVEELKGKEIEFELSTGNSTGYKLETGVLKEKVDNDWQPVASYVYDLQFRYNSTAKIVAITIYGSKGNTDIIRMDTKVYLRVR